MKWKGVTRLKRGGDDLQPILYLIFEKETTSGWKMFAQMHGRMSAAPLNLSANFTIYLNIFLE